MNKLTMPIVTAFITAGCAAPGTPGYGAGANYTPIIDTAGQDMSHYESDIAACRQLARNVDAGRDAAAGAFAGALFGAALSAIVGGGSRMTGQTASAGMLSGGSAAAGNALVRQRAVVINCMAGRGYRTLEGGSVVIQQAAPVKDFRPTVVESPATAQAVPAAASSPE